MNRIIKEATVQRYHYDSHSQLGRMSTISSQPTTSPAASRRSKRLTPYEFICKAWQTQPVRFTINPLHQILGINT